MAKAAASLPIDAEPAAGRPSRAEAEAAVRTLIRWAGDNPDREGLLDTPKRVVTAYEEWFSGYGVDPVEKMGMNVPGCDNRKMALNLMHWLSGLTD